MQCVLNCMCCLLLIQRCRFLGLCCYGTPAYSTLLGFVRRLSERHDRLINRLIDKQLLKALRKRQFPFLPAGIYDLSPPAAAAVGCQTQTTFRSLSCSYSSTSSSAAHGRCQPLLSCGLKPDISVSQTKDSGFEIC